MSVNSSPSGSPSSALALMKIDFIVGDSTPLSNSASYSRTALPSAFLSVYLAVSAVLNLEPGKSSGAENKFFVKSSQAARTLSDSSASRETSTTVTKA